MPDINLHETTDPAVWASEFRRIGKELIAYRTIDRTLVWRGSPTDFWTDMMDGGWLVDWFANAIMAGHENARQKAIKMQTEQKEPESDNDPVDMDIDPRDIITEAMARAMKPMVDDIADIKRDIDAIKKAVAS